MVVAFFVIQKVGLDVFVEVEFLQYRLQGRQPVVVEKHVVGGQCGIGKLDLEALRLLSIDHSNRVGRVFRECSIFRSAHDSGLIEAMQTGYDQRDIFPGESREALLEVLSELVQLLGFHLKVIVIIRLEGLQHGVLLGLDGFIGLIDGEIELRNE